MADYKSMYYLLFDAVTKANQILAEAQEQCEAMYIATEDAEDIDEGNQALAEMNVDLNLGLDGPQDAAAFYQEMDAVVAKTLQDHKRRLALRRAALRRAEARMLDIEASHKY